MEFLIILAAGYVLHKVCNPKEKASDYVSPYGNIKNHPAYDLFD